MQCGHGCSSPHLTSHNAEQVRWIARQSRFVLLIPGRSTSCHIHQPPTSRSSPCQPMHISDEMYVVGVPMGARALRGFTVGHGACMPLSTELRSLRSLAFHYAAERRFVMLCIVHADASAFGAMQAHKPCARLMLRTSPVGMRLRYGCLVQGSY
jgi:hypothetical protein